jgi:hypothetical protein
MEGSTVGSTEVSTELNESFNESLLFPKGKPEKMKNEKVHKSVPDETFELSE